MIIICFYEWNLYLRRESNYMLSLTSFLVLNHTNQSEGSNIHLIFFLFVWIFFYLFIFYCVCVWREIFLLCLIESFKNGHWKKYYLLVVLLSIVSMKMMIKTIFNIFFFMIRTIIRKMKSILTFFSFQIKIKYKI